MATSFFTKQTKTDTTLGIRLPAKTIILITTLGRKSLLPFRESFILESSKVLGVQSIPAEADRLTCGNACLSVTDTSHTHGR